MATVAIGQPTANGPRPVQLRTDLGGIADLIELCFAAVIDESGRAAVRDMRTVARSSPLMFLLSRADAALGGVELGYVWIEDGQVVGNVSVSPAPMPSANGMTYIVANVATHPNYRRRHIAQTLMTKSLEMIRSRRGRAAVLQVDANNPAAQRMYQSLGFRDERIFTRWQRGSHRGAPARLPEMPYITMLDNDWRALYRLASVARPPERGGVGWLRPTVPELFRPSFLHRIGQFMAMKSAETYIVRDNAADRAHELAGSLRIESQFGGPDRFELMVDPRHSGSLERPLLNFGLRRADERFHSATIEHPADDGAANSVLSDYLFERKQTTLQMRYDFTRSIIP